MSGPVYQGGLGNPCQLSTTDPFNPPGYVVVGAEIPGSAIPSAPVQTLGGTTVAVRASVADDGTPVDFHGFVDAVGHACVPLDLEGSTYCAPLQLPQWNIYGPFVDATCSRPTLDVVPESQALSGGCKSKGLAASFVFEGTALGACPNLRTVRPVAAMPTTGPFYSLDALDGTCHGQAPVGQGDVVYALGEPVDATAALPRLTVTIE